MNKFALYSNHKDFKKANEEIEWAVHAAAVILNTIKEKWRPVGADDTASREHILDELWRKL